MHLRRLNINNVLYGLLIWAGACACSLHAESEAIQTLAVDARSITAPTAPTASSEPATLLASTEPTLPDGEPNTAEPASVTPKEPSTPAASGSSIPAEIQSSPQKTSAAEPTLAPAPAPNGLIAPPTPIAPASTSLAAPLNDDTARRFNGQGDVANAVNLHPPGHFTTAEPLNPSAENLLKPDPASPPPAPLAPAGPFTLLGVTLNPGSASRMAWSPEDSFSGIATPTPVLVVHGSKPGPKLCLTAAVHGDEVNGIEVVRHILYELDPNQLAGTVIGVPIVNMQGFRRNSRYLADRRDLNRFFPGNSQGSAASRIAASLFNEVIASCQYLVDIHTGSMARTNLPQLRADLTRPKVVELANMLGDIAVLQNKGTKGSLRRAAMDKNIAAVVIEAGEPYTFQEPAIEKSFKAIQNLLSQLKMYPYSSQATANPRYYKSQWIRVKAGGMLFSRITLGQSVATGDLLGVVTDPITNQSNSIYSPKDAVVLGMALNQVMHPGFAAYHLGIAATVNETQQSDAGPEDFGSDSATPDNLDNH